MKSLFGNLEHVKTAILAKSSSYAMNFDLTEILQFSKWWILPTYCKQCGNLENLHPHFLEKYFVKLTFFNQAKEVTKELISRNIFSLSKFPAFPHCELATLKNKTPNIFYVPSSLRVNRPNCGWSLKVSMQMVSSATNRTIAIWSCLINRGRVLDFSPVFLSTKQMIAFSVTSSVIACKWRTNCLPGQMILLYSNTTTWNVKKKISWNEVSYLL